MIKLTRPLVVLDLETTGLNITEDRIIEIGIVKVYPDESLEKENYRINPEMPIPEAATKVHGITDADVKDEPTFAALAEYLFSVFTDCDICGYNSNYFDVPMLVEHFLRIGKNPFNDSTKFIDVQTIYKKKEERTLSAAVRYFLGKEPEDAHSALYDAEMTADILYKQVERYPDIGNDVDSLAKYSEYENSKRVDFAGKLVRNEKGEICYNIGKAKGTPVKNDPGFGEWMLEKDFPQDTKARLREIFKTNGWGQVYDDPNTGTKDLFYNDEEIERIDAEHKKNEEEAKNEDDLPF